LDLHSDTPLAGQAGLFAELDGLRGGLYRDLALSGSNEPVEVYLFANPKAFNDCRQRYCPGLAARRAFFVQTEERLSVYAQWGDRMGEDLRHETTHAYLHTVIPDLPLWLDEGLAKYYEMPAAAQGLNPQPMRWFSSKMADGQWHPDLVRLEQFSPSTDMRQGDYAEAWAWVHFLLRTRPEYGDLLRRYLAELGHGGQVEPLSTRLRRTVNNPEAMLMEHVGRLLAECGPGQGR
jgi:hypothetical protein